MNMKATCQKTKTDILFQEAVRDCQSNKLFQQQRDNLQTPNQIFSMKPTTLSSCTNLPELCNTNSALTQNLFF